MARLRGSCTRLRFESSGFVGMTTPRQGRARLAESSSRGAARSCARTAPRGGARRDAGRSRKVQIGLPGSRTGARLSEQHPNRCWARARALLSQSGGGRVARESATSAAFSPTSIERDAQQRMSGLSGRDTCRRPCARRAARRSQWLDERYLNAGHKLQAEGQAHPRRFLVNQAARGWVLASKAARPAKAATRSARVRPVRAIALRSKTRPDPGR